MTTYLTYKLGEILSYEQPTNYIVESTEYDDSYPTPVLTAGKSFILGYTNETKGVYDKLPVIIFDDFTTASQFVDFKFKVKSSAMKILSCNEEIADIKYMYYLMQITHIQSDTHKRYWISDYSKVPVSLPPLPTQQAIVARIEALFTELDKAVQHLRTAQQQLKTYRQAVLNHWLNNEDGKWETVKLGEVAEKIQIGPFGTQLHKSDYINGGIPLINPMHISDRKIFPDYSFSVSKEKYEELENYYLKQGDIILGRRGEMGRCAVVTNSENGMLCGTGSLFVRGGEKLFPQYLCYLLSSQKLIAYFENSSSGTTMSNLNRGIVENTEIPLPPLAEQQRIVNEIESRLSQATASETYIENALQQAEALRQSILKKAFSGELVPEPVEGTGDISRLAYKSNL